MVEESNKEPVDDRQSMRKRKKSNRSPSENYDSSKKSRRRSRSRSSSSYDSRSHSGSGHRRSRHTPRKSSILGVFGLNYNTITEDLVEEFSRFGPIYDIRIIYDVKTGNSRGFGFIYYDYVEDAAEARRHCNGMKIHGKRIRVDYSITKRAHTPTPGIYMGCRGKSSYRQSSPHFRNSSYRRNHRRLSYSRSRSR